MNRYLQNFLYVALMAVAFWGSTSWADTQDRSPSSINTWKQELEAFKNRKFSNREEVRKSATEFQNKLMDDEAVRYEQKVELRNQMYKLESQKSSDFPEPRIVGFKKIPVDPSNPAKGYMLEPEYK